MNHKQMTDMPMFASAFVPYQISDFENLFEPDEALCKGTIFPELYLPTLGMEVHYGK